MSMVVPKPSSRAAPTDDQAAAAGQGGDDYGALVAHMTEAFAVHEIVLDGEGTPTDYRFLQVNPAFERMMGLRGADVLGKRVLEVLPHVEPELIERYGKVALTGAAVSFELPVGALGRTYRVTAYRPAPMRFACIFTDVTDEHRAAQVLNANVQALQESEQVLRESEERFERAFHAAPVLMTLSHLEDGRYVEVNEKFCATSGFSRAEVLGRGAVEVGFLAPAEQERLLTELRRAGRVQNLELTAHSKDGRHVVLLYSGELVKVGGQTLLLSIAADITDRKRAEADRERLQAELFQAHKMESIGTLAGGIAHDFNNLLSGIQGGLSFLELELGPTFEFAQDLKEMKALVDRGADLTRQLLGFARRGKFDARPLGVAPVLERTTRMFGRTRKDVVFRLDVPPALPAVLADRTQLEQALLNLLVNAAQAMPGGGTLTVACLALGVDEVEAARQGVAAGTYVRISVADTGVGMDARTRARIFEPFFSTKATGQGTGLGLASVYGIVQNHGGFVEVESELGKGSTFAIYLPATTETAAEEPKAPGLRRGGETILVVDDEEPVMRLTGRLLRSMGYEVLTARSGAEAVELIRGSPGGIALVILDMVMPEMSGEQTFDAIRAIAPSLKVLLSSGYSVEGQAMGILARGANGFIQKPFDVAGLSAKLRELL